jgi:hypothetical protein
MGTMETSTTPTNFINQDGVVYSSEWLLAGALSVSDLELEQDRYGIGPAAAYAAAQERYAWM